MNDSNKYLEGIARAIVWYVFVFAALLAEWWLIKRELDIEYTNAVGTMIKAIGDVALILFPYWLLTPRSRWTALLPICMMTIWGLINLTYYRFWNDIVPPAFIVMTGNVDGNLMGYGTALLRRIDAAFIGILCLACVAILIIKPSKSPSLNLKVKATLTVGSLLLGMAGQAAYLKTSYTWRNALVPLSFREGVTDHFIGGYTGQKQLYLYNGPVYYGIRFVYDAIKVLIESLELSERQRTEIAEFLSRYERNASTDNIPDRRQGDVVRIDSMNVVYIIVESLNADMLGCRIGEELVMPVLDSLAHREGSVVMDNVVSQIKASSSSDGHLLLMTGLLPPEKTSYSIMYGSKNRFPSLGDALPEHNKYLLLADDGVCWNEGETLRNFGLGDPLTVKDRPQYPISEYGRDGAMFMQAAEMMKSMKEPFFMTLMTISMHIPFKEDAWPLPSDLWNVDGLTQMEKDYVNMCRNTDRCIGEFMKTLPDKTLVIIASDHHISVDPDKADTKRALFMAVNSGRTERVSRTIGQVNLFPATLEILGVDIGYRGLAPSAFDERVDGTMDSYGRIYGNPSVEAMDTLGKAYEISDLIIRGDYFQAISR